MMLHSQAGKVANRINVANQSMLKCEDVLNYPGGPIVIVRVLLNGRESQESYSKRRKWEVGSRDQSTVIAGWEEEEKGP